jgi:hypothetical protein
MVGGPNKLDVEAVYFGDAGDTGMLQLTASIDGWNTSYMGVFTLDGILDIGTDEALVNVTRDIVDHVLWHNDENTVWDSFELRRSGRIMVRLNDIYGGHWQTGGRGDASLLFHIIRRGIIDSGLEQWNS